MFKKYYLAYGSNLNLDQMSYRCPTAKPIGKTILKDYRLVYKGKSDDYAYLTIEKCEDSSVPLGIFEISYFDMLSLDIYEGYPTFYSKCYIPIKIGNKTKKALIYVMNENFDYHLPKLKYIETCLKGYKCFGFDSTILSKALNDSINNLQKIKKFSKNITKTNLYNK